MENTHVSKTGIRSVKTCLFEEKSPVLREFSHKTEGRISEGLDYSRKSIFSLYRLGSHSQAMRFLRPSTKYLLKTQNSKQKEKLEVIFIEPIRPMLVGYFLFLGYLLLVSVWVFLFWWWDILHRFIVLIKLKKGIQSNPNISALFIKKKESVSNIFFRSVDFLPVQYEYTLWKKCIFEWPSDLFGQILPGF